MKKRFLLTLISQILISIFSLNVVAKDTWIKVRSKNFLLVGNASEKKIIEVGTKLEQFHEVYSKLFPKANTKFPIPTTVLVFKNEDAFKPFKPLHKGKPAPVDGYFQSGEDVNYIALATDGQSDRAFNVIFHEYVHLLVNFNMQNPPAWFNEGLAEYYSTFEVSDDKKAYLGNIIPNHILLLRRQFMPLKTLFSVDHSSSLYDERNRQSIFYAESWALVHYLIVGNNGQRLPKLSLFLTKLDAGKNIEDAVREAFGMDINQLDKELKHYIDHNNYMRQIATFQEKIVFDSKMQVELISDADVEYYLGDLLLHLDRVDESIVKFKKAIELEPKHAMALSSIGMAYVKQNKFAEAKPYLERAVETESKNHLVYYNYAYMLSREGKKEGDLVYNYPSDIAKKMRTALQKAISLNPEFPESYHLLAFINLVMGENLDESINMLKRVIGMYPGRKEYVLMLAQFHMRKEDFKGARQLLQPVIQSNSDPEYRAYAQSIMKQIDSMEEKLARYKAQKEAYDNRINGQNVPTLGTINANEIKGTMDEKALEQARIEEVLRPKNKDEERVQGYLEKIECLPKGIIVFIRTKDKVIKLYKDDLEKVDFSIYTTETSSEVSCGLRKPASKTVVTYRPKASPKHDGEVISVEFVPASFELRPLQQ
jgi:tetratricopeptide (TPR) repeat protein